MISFLLHFSPFNRTATCSVSFFDILARSSTKIGRDGRRTSAVESQLLLELMRRKLVGASRFGRHVPFAKVRNTTQYKTFISDTLYQDRQ